MLGHDAGEKSVQRLPDGGPVSIASESIGTRDSMAGMTLSHYDITGPAIGVTDIEMQRRKETGEIRRARITILASGPACGRLQRSQVPSQFVSDLRLGVGEKMGDRATCGGIGPAAGP